MCMCMWCFFISLSEVQKHQKPFQLRSAGDGRRSAGGFAAIRQKSERVQQTIEIQRSRIPGSRWWSRGNFEKPVELASNKCSAEKSRRRSGQSARSRRPKISRVKPQLGWKLFYQFAVFDKHSRRKLLCPQATKLPLFQKINFGLDLSPAPCHRFFC